MTEEIQYIVVYKNISNKSVYVEINGTTHIVLPNNLIGFPERYQYILKKIKALKYCDDQYPFDENEVEVE